MTRGGGAETWVDCDSTSYIGAAQRSVDEATPIEGTSQEIKSLLGTIKAEQGPHLLADSFVVGRAYYNTHSRVRIPQN